jgi:mRNA interferase HigB
MKVHLIRKETIEDYARENANSRRFFDLWLTVIKFADWEKPTDMQQTFGSADLLGKGCGRVVFDIGGNNYRMICAYAFGAAQIHLYVKWIGTHTEYDALCAGNRQYTVNKY